MPLPVSLHEVASEMNIQNDQVHAYINKSTGEVTSITDPEIRIAERGYDPDRDPDWHQNVIPRVREVLESEDFLSLPSQWDIHEYEIMERFCQSVENDDHRTQLLRAIRGRGAFQRFREASTRLELRQDWYAYRDEALRRIAATWLEEHEIPYVTEKDPPPL